MTITEWTPENDADIAQAIHFIREDLREGFTLPTLLDHLSDLCGIDRDVLHYEWLLRRTEDEPAQ